MGFFASSRIESAVRMRGTLNPTPARLVVNELQSRRAVAFKADHHVLADVRAAAVVKETFIEIWRTRRKRSFRQSPISLLATTCRVHFKQRRRVLNKVISLVAHQLTMFSGCQVFTHCIP